MNSKLAKISVGVLSMMNLSTGCSLQNNGTGSEVQNITQNQNQVPEDSTNPAYCKGNELPTFSLLSDSNSLQSWSNLLADSSGTQRQGVSARWDNLNRVVSRPAPPLAFSSGNGIRLYLHSQVSNGQELAFRVVAPNRNADGDYYISKLKIDWQGWKAVCIHFANLQRSREPKGLNHSTRFEVWAKNWGIETLANTNLSMKNIDIVTIPQSIDQRTDRIIVDLKDIAPISNLPRFTGLSSAEYVSSLDQMHKDKFVADGLLQLPAEKSHRRSSSLTRLIDSGYEVDQRAIVMRNSASELRLQGKVAEALRLENQAELFALAMSDNNTAYISRLRILLLAMRAEENDTQKLLFKNALVDQLEEITRWETLQRPGWTLFTAGSSLPPGGRDGVWLSHGFLLPDLTLILDDIENEISPVLRDKLRQFIHREMELIFSDWNNKVPWFVQREDFRSNQWVFPNMGVLVAAMYFGKINYLGIDYLSYYNFAAANVIAFGRAQGNSGSFSEGRAYAEMTMGRLSPIIFMAKLGGDNRMTTLAPFFSHFSGWMLRQYLGNGRFLEAFDNRKPRYSPSGPVNESLLGAQLFNTSATFDELVNEGGRIGTRTVSQSLASILYNRHKSSLPSSSVISPYAFYEDQQLLIWQTALANDDATSVWIRGRTHNDSHNHSDGGHISVYKGNKPILLEAGTPQYGTTGFSENFSAVNGHSVLQVGEPKGPKEKASCPITLLNMTEISGEANIECADGYHKVLSWNRKLRWNQSRVVIDDIAFLNSSAPTDSDWFIFHTAMPDSISILSVSPTTFKANIDGATFTFVSSIPFTVLSKDCRNAVMGNNLTDVVTVQCLSIVPQGTRDFFRLKTTIDLN